MVHYRVDVMHATASIAIIERTYDMETLGRHDIMRDDID